MLITHFLEAHWLDLVLGVIIFFAINFRFIPPDMVGLEKEYTDVSTKQQVSNRKQSLLEGVMNMVFTLSRALLALIVLSGTTSLLIFGIVIYQLVTNHTITPEVVILAVVGLIALHFENIIQQADTVSIWKVFTYKRKS